MTKQEWLSSCKSFGYPSLLERAYDNIMANVSSGDTPWSPYRAIRPGRDNHFAGIWNWDTAFHAMCVSRWDTDLAKECILAFIGFQNQNGIYPDVIFLDGNIVDSFSKPPVMATYILTTYYRSNDLDFLRKCFNSLKKNLSFWENNRQINGLFFYSTETTDVTYRDRFARFESGWDDSVRWDIGIDKLFPIDLQCYMIMFYRSMTSIAKILGENPFDWEKKAKKLCRKVNKYFYDKEKGIYVDIFMDNGAFSEVYSPASFMPLYIGIATKKQAKELSIFAKNHFYPAMPTVAYDDPKYSGDYWRGHTWLNVAYFAIKGLKDYGYVELATQMRDTLLSFADKNKDGIYEKYDAITGKGEGCPCFSWSSAFIIEFILNF